MNTVTPISCSGNGGPNETYQFCDLSHLVLFITLIIHTFIVGSVYRCAKGGILCVISCTISSTFAYTIPEWILCIVSCTVCYSSFDLSSIYAVKYHLTMCIHLYQPSFLISMIPGLHSHFPTLWDLPII